MMKKGEEKAVEPGVAMIEVDDTSSSPSASLQLSDLPPEVLIIHIGPRLDNQSKARLSQTSLRFHQFFKEDLEKEAIEKLNSHILWGKESEALSMIASFPKRLRARGTAVDYSGRSFKNVTSFQAALLSHDVTLWKKMEPFFNKLSRWTGRKGEAV